MPANSYHGRGSGAAVVPGTATTAFMFQEKRLAVQVEKRVSALTKDGRVADHHRRKFECRDASSRERVKAVQRQRRQPSEHNAVADANMWNATVRRERSEALKEQDVQAAMYCAAERDAHVFERAARVQQEKCQNIAKSREVRDARLAKCGETQKQRAQLQKSSSAAILGKHQAADIRAKETRMLKRLQAKMQSKLQTLKTELAWANVDESDTEAHEKQRDLEVKHVNRMDTLRKRDAEKEIRHRKVQLVEKNARTNMHQFYPLLKKAAHSGKYAQVWSNLDNYMQHAFSEPNLRHDVVAQKVQEDENLRGR